jgi:hypothetical protein
VRAVGIHLVQDARGDAAPARSAVAAITPDTRLSGVRMCRSDAEIVAAVGESPALVLVDAPLAVPPVTGRRDAEHVLAWLDIPAFPVTPERMRTVHGGARGPGLADRLAHGGHVVAEALPDQVLRQVTWEQDHPPGSPPLDLGAYRAAWLGVRPPAFRPRGGRARHDGLAPARALLGTAIHISEWPTSDRTGDLAALDEAAGIDATACALLAHRCLHGPGDRWALVGDAGAGRVVLAACPEMIDRAAVNIDRLRAEGTIAIPAEVAGSDLGPPQSW